jgi:sugar phosphate isomerase/epimerase
LKLGCSTLLFGGHSLDVALDGIARAGYRAIELCAIPGMAEHLRSDRPPGFYADLAARIRAAGLAIESVGASTNLLDPERRRAFAGIIAIAGRLGAPAITTGSGGASDDPDSFREVVEVLRELATVGADHGVRLSIKPHVRQAVYSTATAQRMLELVDRPEVGLNFDASHLWRVGESPEESLAILGPWIVTARVRDTLSRDLAIGPVETQLPGGGAMNLPAICAGLRKLPLDYAVVEIVGTREWPVEQIQTAIEAAFRGFSHLFAQASDGNPPV